MKKSRKNRPVRREKTGKRFTRDNEHLINKGKDEQNKPDETAVLSLQRSVGNQAVNHLMRSGRKSREAQPGADEMSGASRDVLIAALETAVSSYEKRKLKPKYFDREIIKKYEETGELSFIAFQSPVYKEPKFTFIYTGLPILKRGQSVSVLGMLHNWCRVKTDEGVLGWVPANFFIPKIAEILSTEDKAKNAGSSRDEVEIGGRG